MYIYNYILCIYIYIVCILYIYRYFQTVYNKLCQNIVFGRRSLKESNCDIMGKK